MQYRIEGEKGSIYTRTVQQQKRIFSKENCGWFIIIPVIHGYPPFKWQSTGNPRGASLLHELPDPFVHPLHHGAP